MKYERLTKVPALFGWMAPRLPASLKAQVLDAGYGGYGVNARVRGLKHFFDAPIASIDEDTVTLYAPEYFSDFDALCQQYESETGHTVTLRYWESSKAEP